jgi:hypothetical protein
VDLRSLVPGVRCRPRFFTTDAVCEAPPAGCATLTTLRELLYLTNMMDGWHKLSGTGAPDLQLGVESNFQPHRKPRKQRIGLGTRNKARDRITHLMGAQLDNLCRLVLGFRGLGGRFCIEGSGLRNRTWLRSVVLEKSNPLWCSMRASNEVAKGPSSFLRLAWTQRGDVLLCKRLGARCLSHVS